MTQISTAPTRGDVEHLDESDREAMERYGIIRVPASTYLVGTYRYSNFVDALAEAKRQAS